MAEAAIIGGGPAGLSAALLTAKNGLRTVIFDTDDTSMHSARLRNYLGIENSTGTEFMEIARKQVDEHGAERRQDEKVTDVERIEDGFRVTTEKGEYQSTYVVFASGHARGLATELGCEEDETRPLDTIAINGDCETTVENVYATGWTVREGKIQAAISVGHGASAALDILSKERNEPFHDFDKAIHGSRL
jgi:thioredoxin reductase (NADPH)